MAELRSDRLAQHSVAEIAVILALAVWWLTARDLPAFVLPGPFDVLAALTRFMTEPSLLAHLAISSLRVVSALSIAMILAVLLAVAARASPLAGAIIEQRILLILNSFPSVGWAILGVIWFQVSNLTVVFIETAIVLPFCLINALAGFRQIDPELDEMGRSLTRSRWRRFTKVTLPLVAPFLIAGLRIAYGIGWKIALVAELFGAQSGLGFLLVQAQSTADGAMVFATCLIIVVAVFIVDRFFLAPLARRHSVNQGGSL